MDYQKIYDNIITNRRKNPFKGYTESHHVIPKSMGGSNAKENLVDLSAREHYIVHWLLYKIYKSKEMAHAWNSMCLNKIGTRYTSHSFKYAREAHSKQVSVSNLGNTYAKGKILSEEHKKGISNSLKGKPKSEEHKKKLSVARTGKTLSKDHISQIKERMSGKNNPNFGRKHTKESLNKMSKNRTGKCTGKSHGKSKAVKCITTGKIYDTITQARKDTGATKIGLVCDGKRKTSNKLKWAWFP
jgi:hypothetical protein